MDRAGVFRFLCRERILTPLRARSQAHVTNHTTLTVYNSSLLWLQWDPQTLHILLPSNWATTSAPSRVELSRCHSYSVTSAFPTFTGVRLYLAQHQQNVIWPITELHEGVALKWHAGPSGSTGSEYKQGHPLPFPGRTLSIIPCLLPASLKFLSASVTGQLRALLTLFRNGPLFTVGQFRSLGFMTASQCLESGRAQACLPVPLICQGCGARTLRAANSEREMGGEGWGGAPLEGKGREQDWAEAPGEAWSDRHRSAPSERPAWEASGQSLYQAPQAGTGSPQRLSASASCWQRPQHPGEGSRHSTARATRPSNSPLSEKMCPELATQEKSERSEFIRPSDKMAKSHKQCWGKEVKYKNMHPIIPWPKMKKLTDSIKV